VDINKIRSNDCLCKKIAMPQVMILGSWKLASLDMQKTLSYNSFGSTT